MDIKRISLASAAHSPVSVSDSVTHHTSTILALYIRAESAHRAHGGSPSPRMHHDPERGVLRHSASMMRQSLSSLYFTSTSLHFYRPRAPRDRLTNPVYSTQFTSFRSRAFTTRPQALAQALAPRLALVGCLGGALVGLALAQGSTKARQGLVVPWLMETHQG